MKLAISTLALILVLPGAASTQGTAPRIRVIPTLSTYQPVGKLATAQGGRSDPESAPEWLRMESGYAVGITVDVPLRPVRFLGVRGGVKYAFESQLVAGNYTGTTSCGERCGVARYQSEAVSDAALLAVNTDLVLRPAPSRWPVQPYALGGIAWKSRTLDYGSFPAGSAAEEARKEARGITQHLGLGVDLPLGSQIVSLETDLYGDVVVERGSVQFGSHADSFFSIGLRVGF